MVNIVMTFEVVTVDAVQIGYWIHFTYNSNKSSTIITYSITF
jgi:hypothetical protein